MTFSIITIAYNSGKTIERTILSVLNQSFSDFEYLIIDGASSDGTLDIVKSYDAKFQGRMRWISEPDGGIYDAMNKGIHMAKGELIGIVNSDDWLEQDALETISSSLRDNHNDMNCLYCGWINFHYTNGVIQTLKTDHNLLVSRSSKYEMAGIRHPAVFVPRNIYNQYGVFDTRMRIMADSDFILRCFFNGVKFIYPNKVVSNMSDGGISNKSHLRAFGDYKQILKKYKMSKLKYLYLLFRWSLRSSIKYLFPAKAIYVYRIYSKA